MHAETITCLNGKFLPSSQALLPVADRGFRFGDGVFETIRVENGIPYQFSLHLSRMEAGLAMLHITPPATDWQTIAKELLTQNQARDGFLRLAISRGVGSEGYLPKADITPNWVMEYLPPSSLPQQPFTLWHNNIQRSPCNYKLAQGVNSTLALMQAKTHDCDEALMLNAEGQLCEAAAANIFWITEDKLFTPALTTGCLAGTTRAAVMRVCPTQEVSADVSVLDTAEAMFLTNVRLGTWPVQRIGEKIYNPAHPLLLTIQQKLSADREGWQA